MELDGSGEQTRFKMQHARVDANRPFSVGAGSAFEFKGKVKRWKRRTVGRGGSNKRRREAVFIERYG